MIICDKCEKILVNADNVVVCEFYITDWQKLCADCIENEEVIHHFWQNDHVDENEIN